LEYDIAKQQCANQTDACCRNFLEQVKSDETRRVVIIASSVAGGVVLLILIIVAIYCIRKRNQAKSPKGFVVHHAEQVSRPSGDAVFKQPTIAKSSSQKTLEAPPSSPPKDYFGVNNANRVNSQSDGMGRNLTFTALQQPSPVMTSLPPAASLFQSVQETKHPNSAPVQEYQYHAIPAPLSAPVMDSNYH
jgi:hypothetical protein